MNARIAYLDIETAPLAAYAWGLWDQNIGINQIVSDPRILGLGFSWEPNRSVHYASEMKLGRQGLLDVAYDVLDAADVVVHYNGTTFDTPWMYAEFAKEGMTPPSPFKTIDLYKVARKNFRLPSYKLQYVAHWFGIGGKLDTGGFGLWADVMAGDPKADAKMARYCRQDVRLLPDLLDKLTPWLPASVNMALLHGVEDLACVKCGSTDLESRGVAYTASRAYPQYRCRACGGWTRDTRSVGGVKGAGVSQ